MTIFNNPFTGRILLYQYYCTFLYRNWFLINLNLFFLQNEIVKFLKQFLSVTLAESVI